VYKSESGFSVTIKESLKNKFEVPKDQKVLCLTEGQELRKLYYSGFKDEQGNSVEAKFLILIENPSLLEEK